MGMNESTTQLLGRRIGEAADFLINLLAGEELPSTEVNGLADAAGINHATLNRAKRIVNAKARKKNHRWYISVSEEMKGHTFGPSKQKECLFSPIANHTISSDWVTVVMANDDNRHKIDIPTRAMSGAGLRVKVGQYEFEADENFPADKLAELLRGLAVDGG